MAGAHAIVVLATPAGISGAVLLRPFQVSVLGTSSPAVTPDQAIASWPSRELGRFAGAIGSRVA
jgi:hypothetical protein